MICEPVELPDVVSDVDGVTDVDADVDVESELELATSEQIWMRGNCLLSSYGREKTVFPQKLVKKKLSFAQV